MGSMIPKEMKLEIVFVKHYAQNHMLASKDNITRTTPNGIMDGFFMVIA